MNENTRWYVEVDPFTNESLAAELSRRNISAGSDQLFYDENGKGHNGWDVPYSLIALLQKGKIVFPFKLKVFVEEKGRKAREFKPYKRTKKSELTKKFSKKIKEKLKVDK